MLKIWSNNNKGEPVMMTTTKLGEIVDKAIQKADREEINETALHKASAIAALQIVDMLCDCEFPDKPSQTDIANLTNKMAAVIYQSIRNLREI